MQSTALVVLAVQGLIDADVALFANVGDNADAAYGGRLSDTIGEPQPELPLGIGESGCDEGVCFV